MEPVEIARETTIAEVIDILNNMGVFFRYEGRDLREYLMARLGIPEVEWAFFLDGEVILSQEEFDKLPQV